MTYSNSAGSGANTGPRSISFSLGSGNYYPTSGHFYEYVPAASMTWTNAKAAAAARSYFGLQGYLVTVTSAGENAFVQARLGGNGWMGASTPVFTLPRTWSWVTGPEAGTAFFTQTGGCTPGRTTTGGGSAIGGAYSNWSSGEPNNFGCIESDAHFYSATRLWNDFASNNASISGYAVEYGGMPADPTVGLSGTRALAVSLTAFAVNFQTDGTSGTSLSGTTAQTVATGASSTPVTANPSASTYLANWTGTGGFVTTTANPLTVGNVSAAMTVTANFAAKAATSVSVSLASTSS